MRFSPSAKAHDGPCLQTRVLEALVVGYFELQCVKQCADVAALVLREFGRVERDVLGAVRARLVALDSRLGTVPANGSVAVVASAGGGGTALHVGAGHRAHVRRLAQLVLELVQEPGGASPASEGKVQAKVQGELQGELQGEVQGEVQGTGLCA